MKIAFVGKGGSGKTTISSLFVRYLASLSLPVLSIDGDINQHMGAALGFSESDIQDTPALGLEIDYLKNFFRGSNPRIFSSSLMVKTTPPGTGSRLINFDATNEIFSHFAYTANGITFMRTGPFSENDLGVACYHSKLGGVEILLNHLIDREKEYIVVDMTAGADSFASGLFAKFDLTILVVEPTLKSLAVYEQYKHYAKGHNVAIRVVGNKVESEDDIAFIKTHTGADFLTSFASSPFVKKSEQGSFLPLTQLEPHNMDVLRTILGTVDLVRKDWDQFYDQTVEFHIKNALDWANAIAGADVTLQVDPEFKLSDHL